MKKRVRAARRQRGGVGGGLVKGRSRKQNDRLGAFLVQADTHLETSLDKYTHVNALCTSFTFPQPSTNQIAVLTRATPAIYQSYTSPGWAKSPRIWHIVHVLEHIKTHNAQQLISGKATEYRRRARSCTVDPLSRRREVAYGVRSSPKPEHTIFFA